MYRMVCTCLSCFLKYKWIQGREEERVVCESEKFFILTVQTHLKITVDAYFYFIPFIHKNINIFANELLTHNHMNGIFIGKCTCCQRHYIYLFSLRTKTLCIRTYFRQNTFSICLKFRWVFSFFFKFDKLSRKDDL